MVARAGAVDGRGTNFSSPGSGSSAMKLRLSGVRLPFLLLLPLDGVPPPLFVLVPTTGAGEAPRTSAAGCSGCFD